MQGSNDGCSTHGAKAGQELIRSSGSSVAVLRDVKRGASQVRLSSVLFPPDQNQRFLSGILMTLLLLIVFLHFSYDFNLVGFNLVCFSSSSYGFKLNPFAAFDQIERASDIAPG
jgi:hypothetical protein